MMDSPIIMNIVPLSLTILWLVLLFGWVMVVALQWATLALLRPTLQSYTVLISHWKSEVIFSLCGRFTHKWHNVRESVLTDFYCFQQGNLANYLSANGEGKMRERISLHQPTFFFLGHLPATQDKRLTEEKSEKLLIFYLQILPTCTFLISQFKE